MNTILFVDNCTQGIGYQLSRNNLNYAPSGQIRVARFTTAFSPQDGMGYYGDVYMRILVRKWKKRALRKQNLRTLLMCTNHYMNSDVRQYISEFI